MIYSIKQIAEKYSELSNLRKDVNRFNYSNFITFAENNKTKYNLIEIDNNLFVSSWYHNELINDYRKTINYN